MTPENRTTTHPGKVLVRDFLLPTFAERAGFCVHGLEDFVEGKADVTSEAATLLANATGTTPQFWLNLQSTYESSKRRVPKCQHGIDVEHPCMACDELDAKEVTP